MRPLGEWAIFKPVDINGRTMPPIALVAAATVGAILLLVVVAANRWGAPQDEHAYWLAGQRLLAGEPLYDPAASPVTPYAYWYPPIVAQVLAPVTAVLPSDAFSAAWTVLMLGCLWWLAGGSVLWMLALVAFPPVAIEFWFRNVHLVLAVLIVLGIRRWSGWFAVGAAIKLSPALGIPYLGVRRRWREATVAAAVGMALLVVSVLISPDAWRLFLETVGARGAGDVSGFLPIPYIVRAVVGLGLAMLAGTLRPRLGEPLLVVAIVVALPTLWATALSTLIAIVPLVRTPPAEVKVGT